MSWPRHRVPAEVFAALAAGDGGSAATKLLAGVQRSRRLLLVRAVADRAGPADRDLVHAYRLLAELQTRSPEAADAVEQVLAYPSITGWAVQTLRALAGTGRPLPPRGQLAAAAAAAAVRARADVRVAVPVRDGRVVLPSIGSARIGPPGARGQATVSSGPRGAIIEAGPVRVAVSAHESIGDWTTLPRLTLGDPELVLDVAVDEVDPFTFPGQPAARLAPPDLARWRDTGRAGWRLLARLPATAAEVADTLTAFVPVPARTGQTSATSRDTHGALALSEPPDAAAFAATLVHEVQHAKLHALLDLVPLLHPAADERWYSPWRDDPRPLAGLLQGAYAHVGVARFWLRQLRPEPDRTDAAYPAFARAVGQTWEAIGTLRSSGRLTERGEAFVAGMAATVRGWRAEPVPPAAAAQARADRDRHRDRWQRRHGPLPP